MPCIVNIGLNREGKDTLAPRTAYEALAEKVIVGRTRLAQSTTERTLVAEIDRPLTGNEAYALCLDLGQQAIAQSVDGVGDIIGPQRDAWLPFNPEYFLAF